MTQLHRELITKLVNYINVCFKELTFKVCYISKRFRSYNIVLHIILDLFLRSKICSVLKLQCYFSRAKT